MCLKKCKYLKFGDNLVNDNATDSTFLVVFIRLRYIFKRIQD